MLDTGEMLAARPPRHHPTPEGAGERFRATLRDGREVEVSRMDRTAETTATRIGWTVTSVRRRQPGHLGLAWFAPVPSTAGHALAEVVVNHGLEGTGLALLLFDLVVLTAMADGVGTLSLFLPGHAEDFVPAVTTLGGRIVSSGGEVMVVDLPLGRGPRRYVGSGMHHAIPATVGVHKG